MHDTWNPWAELAGRTHIIFKLHPIAKIGGGALYSRRGDQAAIVIDPDLSARERRAALAHELVHDERGGLCDHRDSPDSWGAIVAREERTVERIVAARLVPIDQLQVWVSNLTTVGQVLLADIAEEFDVPCPIAGTAVGILKDTVALSAD